MFCEVDLDASVERCFTILVPRVRPFPSESVYLFPLTAECFRDDRMLPCLPYVTEISDCYRDFRIVAVSSSLQSERGSVLNAGRPHENKIVG